MTREFGPKLSPSQRYFVCEQLALGFSPAKTAQSVRREFNIDISHQAVEKYRHSPKWKKIIRLMQERIVKEIMKIPIAKKAQRLKYLQEAISEAFTWRVTQRYYDKHGHETGKVERMNLSIVPQLIKEARAEIEGDKSLIINNGKLLIVQQLHSLVIGNGKSRKITDRFNTRRSLEIAD